nr:MAG TPA: hypothetical protein [Caudoviricetes sp.]DAV67932.1 MAG TPA: hypothetical protein [Caudoviricetes sp.]
MQRLYFIIISHSSRDFYTFTHLISANAYKNLRK